MEKLLNLIIRLCAINLIVRHNGCQAEWINNGIVEFFFSPDTAGCSSISLAQCLSMNASLASLSDNFNFVRSWLLNNADINSSYYVGGAQLQPNPYHWFDESEFPGEARWGPYQPHVQTNAFCIVMRHTNVEGSSAFWMFNDRCDRNFNYICRRQADRIWSDWGSWGSCSSTCEPGSRDRSRHCIDYNKNGSNYCIPPDNVHDHEPCNTHLCNDTEIRTTPCNATCGYAGIQQRYFACKYNHTFPESCSRRRTFSCSGSCTTNLPETSTSRPTVVTTNPADNTTSSVSASVAPIIGGSVAGVLFLIILIILIVWLLNRDKKRDTKQETELQELHEGRDGSGTRPESPYTQPAGGVENGLNNYESVGESGGMGNWDNGHASNEKPSFKADQTDTDASKPWYTPVLKIRKVDEESYNTLGLATSQPRPDDYDTLSNTSRSMSSNGKVKQGHHDKSGGRLSEGEDPPYSRLDSNTHRFANTDYDTLDNSSPVMSPRGKLDNHGKQSNTRLENGASYSTLDPGMSSNSLSTSEYDTLSNSSPIMSPNEKSKYDYEHVKPDMKISSESAGYSHLISTNQEYDTLQNVSPKTPSHYDYVTTTELMKPGVSANTYGKLKGGEFFTDQAPAYDTFSSG